MKSVNGRKLNVLDLKCLKSLVGVSRFGKVRSEQVRRRAGIEGELASRVDESVEMVWICGENG